MSHFFADIQGNRGSTSRGGSKASGIRGHIRGWHVGVQVYIDHKEGKDTVRIYKTGGSSNSSNGELLAEYTD